MYHIGIDVHKLRCVVAIKGESSPEVLQRTSFANDIDGITGFLELLDKEDYLPAKGGRLRVHLHILGAPLRHAHGYRHRNAGGPSARRQDDITQTKYKDDKIDAERLAEMSRLGHRPASYIPTKKGRDRRKLTRSRHGLKSSISTYKNRIEAAIATYPLKRPTGDLYSGPRDGPGWRRPPSGRPTGWPSTRTSISSTPSPGQADRLGKVDRQEGPERPRRPKDNDPHRNGPTSWP